MEKQRIQWYLIMTEYNKTRFNSTVLYLGEDGENVTTVLS